jgi:hypothetical protein
VSQTIGKVKQRNNKESSEVVVELAQSVGPFLARL